MFSFAASAITLANTIANVLLNQMVVRRHNMARATALGCSPLSRCILKKRKIRRKRRFWLKPGRTDLWWQNMLQNRCLEEDWRKDFWMSKNEFMKLVDELWPSVSPDPRSPRRGISAEKRVRGIELKQYGFLDCLRGNLLYLGVGEQIREIEGKRHHCVNNKEGSSLLCSM